MSYLTAHIIAILFLLGIFSSIFFATVALVHLACIGVEYIIDNVINKPEKE